MTKKKSYSRLGGVIPLIFLFLISSIFVIADSTYPFLSGENDNYLIDEVTSPLTSSNFNSLTVDDISYFTKTLDDGNFAPLIADLDGVSPKEIIIISDTNLLIYQKVGNILNFMDGIDLDTSTISPPYVYDIDGDGTDEIIIDRGSSIDNISIYNYSSSSINKEYDLSYSFAGDYIHVLACKDTNDCITLFSDTGDITLRGISFNASGLSSIATIETVGAGTEDICIPFIRNIVVEEDEDKFIFSGLEITETSEKIHVWSINTDGTSPALSKHSETGTGGVLYNSAGSDCASELAGKYITSPLVFDFKDTPVGTDVLVGVNVDTDEFRIFLFGSDLVFSKKYPNTFLADGLIISNLIKMNAFPRQSGDAKDEDVCLVGYQDTLSRIDVLCASERGEVGILIDSDEFKYDVNVSILTSNPTDFYSLVHGVQATSELEDGNNPTEVLTSFGIFHLDFTLINELEPVWINPKGSSMIVPNDYDDDARNELFMITETNLWVASDGFTNTHCDTYNCIRDDSQTNPSINNIIKINTTFQVQLLIEDFDGDNVAGRVILYEGDTNEQDSGWSINSSSGTTFSFGDLKVNKTGTYVIQFKARDTDDPSKVETITLPFTVALEGSEFGETLFLFGATEEEEGDVVDVTENVISESLDGLLVDNSGLSRTVWWLIIMVIIAIVMLWWANSEGASHSHLNNFIMPLIMFVEFLMIIIGVYLEYFNPALVISIIVVSAILIGLFFGRRAFASQ